MIDIYKIVRNGQLEEAVVYIKKHKVDVVRIFEAIVNMKSRTFKLYKQIVLTKIVLMHNEIDDKQGMSIINTSVKNNCTYITKQFLRFGYTVTVEKNALKKNMILLIESFGG